MNIIVIGSCTDSSNLATDLNKRLSNSIVARIDLLRTVKALFLDKVVPKATKNIGTYVGDVESYDISGLSTEQLQSISSAILETLSKTKHTEKIMGKDGSDSRRFISGTFDGLTNSFSSGAYSFVKIYSGIVNDDLAKDMLRDKNLVSNSIVVVLKTPSTPLIPINLSTKVLEELKETSFSAVECSSIEEIYKTELFQILFKDELKETKEEEVKTPSLEEAVEVEMAMAA